MAAELLRCLPRPSQRWCLGRCRTCNGRGSVQSARARKARSYAWRRCGTCSGSGKRPAIDLKFYGDQFCCRQPPWPHHEVSFWVIDQRGRVLASRLMDGTVFLPSRGMHLDHRCVGPLSATPLDAFVPDPPDWLRASPCDHWVLHTAKGRAVIVGRIDTGAATPPSLDPALLLSEFTDPRVWENLLAAAFLERTAKAPHDPPDTAP